MAKLAPALRDKLRASLAADQGEVIETPTSLTDFGPGSLQRNMRQILNPKLPRDAGARVRSGMKMLADMTLGSMPEKPPPNAGAVARFNYLASMPGVLPLGTFKTTPESFAALQGTPGTQMHGVTGDPWERSVDAVELALHRRQLPQQAGSPSVRSGVFFTAGEPRNRFMRHYTGKHGYGGEQRISTTGKFERPIVVKAGTGGKGPERAYDQIMGKGAYEKMRDEFLGLRRQGFRPLPGGGYSDVHPTELADFLRKHGGDPNLADEILAVSTKGNQLAYAVQENIVANTLKKHGHDAVISYTKSKGQPVVSEVFDLTRSHYPEPE